MTTLANSLLADARAFLATEYLPKITKCLELLSEEDVWWRPNAESNSIGNLILHLDGSTRMWVIAVAAGRPNQRDRDAEFAARESASKAELLAHLRTTLTEVDDTLAALDEPVLLERRQWKGEDITGLWAVMHAVEHFAMHTGQIIMLAKMRTGKDLHLVY
jgi:uncharacterized damage-inducible protein DinB